VDWIGEPPRAELQVYRDTSRQILSKNESPDIPFRWSLNPYRGCFHGCAYCYARPSHEYLGFGAGTDFERRLVVKENAAELLRATFEKRSWEGELIVFSGNTDPYQPLEAGYGITRACLEVCLEYRNPVGMITKGALIERDAVLLGHLAREAYCQVVVSIPFAQSDLCRAIEPYAPSPSRRFEIIRRLAREGVPVGVNVAPVIPGLNDSDIPEILERAREAGAGFAGKIMVRLPGPVGGIFEARLREALPLRAERVLHQIEESRGGARTEGRFGRRMTGEGPRWAIVEELYRKTCTRLGLGSAPTPPNRTSFRRPGEAHQLSLGL
jgi:DNA repair photolyase